jgi:cbb3-type cytochrome oxidase subunit 1
LAPWEDSLIASAPFWLTRTLSGTLIIVAQLVFLANIYMTWKHNRVAAGAAAKETIAGNPAVA